jgi:hypothetical protein
VPSTRSGPPRPLNVGDIVTCYHHLLGEWTAAQITDVQHEWKQVAVLELDWSGPEPSSVQDLGEVPPLRRPRGPEIRRPGVCQQKYVEWVLPRSYTVIGTLPLLTSEPTSIGSLGWRVGDSLWALRRWQAGAREEFKDPTSVNVTGMAFRNLLSQAPDSSILSLSVFSGGDVDVDQVADLFPQLAVLYISGDLDTLINPRGDRSSHESSPTQSVRRLRHDCC